MSRWFRMYDELLDSPKVQRLPPVLFKAWVNLLCLSSRCDGVLPCLDDIAFSLRTDVETVSVWLSSLSDAGLLDKTGSGTSPHNWAERQFVSDKDPTAAERQARKRARDKEISHAAVTRDVTPPRTDTDTDTDISLRSIKRGRAGAASHRVSDGKQILIEAGVPENVLNDWISVRKAKRAGPITETVAEGVLSSAAEWGEDPAQLIATSVLRGWQGVFQPKSSPFQRGSPRQELTGFHAVSRILEGSQ